MAWSIFSNGGGDGAAYTWAKDLLKKIGAPLTAGNEQFVFDWEVSEGGGGMYNPLNQGPVPNDSSLTTSGSQYGGGAADYASWGAGLQGAADYLAMPDYQAIAADLRANKPAAARSALISSGWAASHYGYGSAFSDQSLPGQASALSAAGGSAGGSDGSGGGILGIPGALSNLTTDLSHLAIIGPVVVLGGGLIILGAAKATGLTKRGSQAASTAAAAAAVA